MICRRHWKRGLNRDPLSHLYRDHFRLGVRGGTAGGRGEKGKETDGFHGVKKGVYWHGGAVLLSDRYGYINEQENVEGGKKKSMNPTFV